MSRRTNLERFIHESTDIIHDYEAKKQLSDDPREKRRCDQQIKQQRELLRGHLDEYVGLCKAFNEPVPAAIQELVVSLKIIPGAPGSVAPAQETKDAARIAPGVSGSKGSVGLEDVDPVKLLEAMQSAFGPDDFEILCFELGVSTAELEGNVLRVKMMSLIKWHQGRDIYAKLVKKVLEKRPFLRARLEICLSVESEKPVPPSSSEPSSATRQAQPPIPRYDEGKTTSWMDSNAMNPEQFVEQGDVRGLTAALNRFASEFHSADDRRNTLISAGVDPNSLGDLNFSATPSKFAIALLAEFRNYPISDQRLDYHPMIASLSHLLDTGPAGYGLADQDVALCTRLVERGRENLRALRARSAVGRIESPRGTGIGTGVLVGRNLLLTCRHVFSKHHIEQAWVHFNYRAGRYELEEDVFELDLEFVSEKSRPDYALIRVKGAPRQQLAIPVSRVLSGGEEIRIIHHPQGQPVVISGVGQVVQVGEDYIDHDISTDEGSSGAPIFDASWDLIAIHRGRPGLGREVPSGTTEGLPIYAIWDRVSHHLA